MIKLLGKLTGARDAAARAAEELKAQLGALDTEIDTRTAEVERLRGAYPTVDEFVAIGERIVDDKATRWAADHGLTFMRRLAGREHVHITGVAAPTPQPDLSYDLPGLLPGDRECFFYRQREKASIREAIGALSALCGDLPAPKLAARLADAERELAELHATREQLVDAMNTSGIHVDHRPEVLRRRAEQARADELAAQRREREEYLKQHREHRTDYLVADFMPGSAARSPYLEREHADRPAPRS